MMQTRYCIIALCLPALDAHDLRSVGQDILAEIRHREALRLNGQRLSDVDLVSLVRMITRMEYAKGRPK
jgi:hypothetical protein